jgi:hypothetical protein
MGFLLKFVAVVLAVNGVLLGAVVTYRNTTEPTLYRILQVNDDCGLVCWFGVPPDGSVVRRDIIERVDNTDTQLRLINRQGSNLNFALEEEPGGTLSVQLIEGYGIVHCYFPRPTAVTIGEVHAAFGEPDYFALFNRGYWEFHMRFAAQQILVKGTVSESTAFADRLWDALVVQSICAAEDITLLERDIGAMDLPLWRGYDVAVQTYHERPLSLQFD